jgi:hypothetical protein
MRKRRAYHTYEEIFLRDSVLAVLRSIVITFASVVSIACAQLP